MLRIDRRLISNIEWPLLLLALLLVGCGLLTILSATFQDDRALSPYVVKQAMWAALGLVGLVAAIAFDYRLLHRYGYVLYLLSVASLVVVRIAGVEGGGARRWLSVGPFALQPSEFAKIAIVAVLATNLHRWAGETRLSVARLLPPLALFGLPAFLILRQPDLGTVILIGIVAFTVLLIAGLPLRIVLAASLVVGPALPVVWQHLKPYQKRRIVSFFDPQADPLGAGYHVLQSQIAIGSGMVHGKGYLSGTQNHLNFLPEQHTDFVFSVFAEEWGFLGCGVLLSLYLALVLRGAIIASRARDNLGALLAAGLTAMIFWQVVINIAMTSGSLPVVGITLPFLSYGGSSLLVLLTSIGLIMNVSMRRFAF
jgi:rod shape determining protein RodA